MSFDPTNMVYFSEESLTDHLATMENFWQKVARVTTHKILLTEERNRLLEENSKYKEILRTQVCLPTAPKLPLSEPLGDREVVQDKCKK